MVDNAMMKIPDCPIHEEQLVHRSNGSQEQEYCGVWYTCSQCGYTVLIPATEIEGVYAAR